jgi:hypothetical protein
VDDRLDAADFVDDASRGAAEKIAREGAGMNAVEIEEAISTLAERPFDAGEFPFDFLQAFGNKDTTIKRLRKGESNRSDLGGVLQTNNIHIAVATPGEVTKTLAALKATSSACPCCPTMTGSFAMPRARTSKQWQPHSVNLISAVLRWMRCAQHSLRGRNASASSRCRSRHVPYCVTSSHCIEPQRPLINNPSRPGGLKGTAMDWGNPSDCLCHRHRSPATASRSRHAFRC